MVGVGPTRVAVIRGRCWLFAMLGLLFFYGAGVGEGLAAPGELRIGVPHLPGTLDPATVASGSELMVFRLMFQGLVEFGDRGEIEPGLAIQWAVTRDGLTWTFRLRPDAVFHNGVQMTVDDVVASMARHLSPDEPREPVPPWTRLFRGPSRLVREVRRGEPGTVQLQLSQPYSPLLAVLAHPALAIVTTHHDGEVRFLGTGAYRPVEHGPGRLVLEAGPGNRGEPPRTERVIFTEVADDAAGVAGLSPRGDLHVYFAGVPPAWAGLGLQVLSAPSWRMGFLALRTDQGVLSKKALRQTIALSLDPALIQPAFGRWATRLSSYLPPGAWGARDISPPAHDPARARRVLAQAGPGDPTLTLLASESASGPDPSRLTEALRLSLAPAGIKLNVRVEPNDLALRGVRQGEAHLAIHDITLEVNDPHFLFQPLLASEATGASSASNVAFLRSSLVDGMLLRASQLGFRPERLRLYHRLQAYLAEELPYIPLYTRLQWALARPAVRGLRLDPGRFHRLDRVWVEGPSEPGVVAPPAPTVGPPPPPLPPPRPPALPVPALPVPSSPIDSNG